MKKFQIIVATAAFAAAAQASALESSVSGNAQWVCGGAGEQERIELKGMESKSNAQLLFVTANRRVQDDDVAVGGPFEPEVLRDQRPDLGEARLPSKRRRRQPAREVARVDVTIPVEQSGIGFEIRVRAQQFFRAARVAHSGR